VEINFVYLFNQIFFLKNTSIFHVLHWEQLFIILLNNQDKNDMEKRELSLTISRNFFLILTAKLTNCDIHII
jgi:hypothetical protein